MIRQDDRILGLFNHGAFAFDHELVGVGGAACIQAAHGEKCPPTVVFPQIGNGLRSHQQAFACLYDHENDPREMKNLLDLPEHEDVREKLHAQTLAWMEKFGDTGMVYKELIERVMVKEDIVPGPFGTIPGPSGQGRLKGRPEDILAGKIK